MMPSVPKNPSIGFAIASESKHDCWMFAIALLFVRVVCDCFESRRRLEADGNAALSVADRGLTKSCATLSNNSCPRAI